MGVVCIKGLGQIGSELWFPWQLIAPIGYNGQNLVTTLAFSFLIGSSLILLYSCR